MSPEGKQNCVPVLPSLRMSQWGNWGRCYCTVLSQDVPTDEAGWSACKGPCIIFLLVLVFLYWQYCKTSNFNMYSSLYITWLLSVVILSYKHKGKPIIISIFKKKKRLTSEKVIHTCQHFSPAGPGERVGSSVCLLPRLTTWVASLSAQRSSEDTFQEARTRPQIKILNYKEKREPYWVFYKHPHRHTHIMG